MTTNLGNIFGNWVEGTLKESGYAAAEEEEEEEGRERHRPFVLQFPNDALPCPGPNKSNIHESWIKIERAWPIRKRQATSIIG